MQSMDDAGNISWSSLIPVTSLFPKTRTFRVSGSLKILFQHKTMWGLFYLREERLKRNPPGWAQPLSVYVCPVFPAVPADLVRAVTPACKPCPDSDTLTLALTTLPDRSRSPHGSVTVLWCEDYCYKSSSQAETFLFVKIKIYLYLSSRETDSQSTKRCPAPGCQPLASFLYNSIHLGLDDHGPTVTPHRLRGLKTNWVTWACTHYTRSTE